VTTVGSRRSTVRVLLALLIVTGACGKKGDPQAPLPRGPNAVSDLSAEQEGDDAILTFTFPTSRRSRSIGSFTRRHR
jgi:hypothetical protein